jgi:hypothetical protein
MAHLRMDPSTMRRPVGFLVTMIVVLGASVLSTGVATAASAGRATGQDAQPSTSDAQEVRTVWTGELGVAHPAGLAYDPSRREFLVAADTADATRVLRLGPDEERRGTSTLPPLRSPETLAVDAAQHELTAIDGDQAVQVPTDALDRSSPPASRVPIGGLQLDDPESATFDPSTDTWFVLDERDDAVAVVAGDDPATMVDELQLAGSGADRVIAFNPSDELLYVLDPAEQRVDAIDLQGDVQRRIGLASTELEAPVAMTFAPTTDATDDAGSLNLYVADAGSGATLGGVTELSLAAVTAAAAPVDNAALVRTVRTSAWTPASPDPAGVVWTPASSELVVVDSEVDETTGAGWHDVNLWRASRTGTVRGTGALWGPDAAGNFSREPTGLGYDDASRTLYVSDDSANAIFAVRRGGDGVFGTRDDRVTSINTARNGGNDTEDPEFDPRSGDLFYLDGVGREIFRIDPVDGAFGNADDRVSHFDISHLGPADFEGLASNPDRRTLYVGARTTGQIFEITHGGDLVRTISTSGVAGLRRISGLGIAPASDGSSRMNLWIVDRATDNGSDPTENDGKMFEISAPDIGGGSVSIGSKVVFHRIVYNPRGRDTGTNAHLNEEMVVLRNTGATTRRIHNWLVRDRAGNRYRIPDGFRLGPGRYVRIHTGRGTDDGNDLYWGRTRYVWNNGGDRATLKDRKRRVRDRCSYGGGGNSVRC